MQRAAAEMLQHHQQLAALEHDRHISMLHKMQVDNACEACRLICPPCKIVQISVRFAPCGFTLFVCLLPRSFCLCLLC